LGYGNPAFFLTQLKAMAIAVGYSFAVSGLSSNSSTLSYDQGQQREEAEGWMPVSMMRTITGYLLVARRKA